MTDEATTTEETPAAPAVDEDRIITAEEFVKAMDVKYGSQHDDGWIRNVTHELVNGGVKDAVEANDIARVLARATVQGQYTAEATDTGEASE